MAATVATMSVDATSVVANGAAGDNFLFGSDPMEEEGEDDKDEDGGKGPGGGRSEDVWGV